MKIAHRLATFKRFVFPLIYLTFIGIACYLCLKLKNQLSTVSAQSLTLCLTTGAFIHVVSLLLSSASSRIFLKNEAGTGPTFLQAFSGNIIITLGKYIPGKIWGIWARLRFYKHLGIEIENYPQKSIAEQICVLAACFTTGAAFYLAGFQWVFGFLLLLLSPLLVLMCNFLLLKVAVIRKITKKFRYTTENLKFIVCFCYQSLSWIVAGISLFCIFRLGFKPAHLSVPASLFNCITASTAGYLTGFLAILVPAGAGVREVTGAALLVGTLTFKEASLLMLLYRISITIAELCCAVLLGLWILLGTHRSWQNH